MSKRRSHEEFVSEMRIINPNIKVLGHFTTVREKLECECIKDGYKWFVEPSMLLSGRGCPKCAGNIKKTHQQFCDELTIINPNIKVIGKYIGNQTKIEVECLKDKYRWFATPKNLLRGTGCPKCSGKMQKTHEQFCKELHRVNPNVKVLGAYQTINTPIEVECLKCGYKRTVTPNTLLNQSRNCPKCAKNLKITHESFMEQMQAIHPNVIVLEKYSGRNVPLQCECRIDKHKWHASPFTLITLRQGCPKCRGFVNSIGEDIIYHWLDKHNIKFTYQKRFKDCKDKRVLPFDFFLPDFNLLIEYDGRQHFQPVNFGSDNNVAQNNFETTRRHDNIKNEYCRLNNIQLLRIPYWNINKIDSIISENIKIRKEN